MRLSKMGIRKFVLIVALLVFFGSMIFYLIKDLSPKTYWTKSGFQTNQELMRQEFYKREVRRLFNNRIGFFYLTESRFVIDRIDQEFAKLFDIRLHPVIVGSLVVITILI